MNKQMNAPALQKIMTDFARENEISEVTQEMIGDTLDDAFEEAMKAKSLIYICTWIKFAPPPPPWLRRRTWR